MTVGVQSVRFNERSNKHRTHARMHECTGPSLQIMSEQKAMVLDLIHLKSHAAIPSTLKGRNV